MINLSQLSEDELGDMQSTACIDRLHWPTVFQVHGELERRHRLKEYDRLSNMSTDALAREYYLKELQK